jgi:hypothetical protein
MDPLLRGSAAQGSFMRGGRSSHRLELDPARLGDPLGGIQDLQRDQVPVLVVVENDARLVLVALGDSSIRSQDDAQPIGSRVISGFYGLRPPILCCTARPVNRDDLCRVARPSATATAITAEVISSGITCRRRLGAPAQPDCEYPGDHHQRHRRDIDAEQLSR